MRNPTLKEKRWLSPDEDQARIDDMLHRLRQEMGTAVNLGYMVRALLKVWEWNEDAVYEALTEWDWERPENGDHEATDAHVEELAEVIQGAVRS